jgi:hypothetical protein
VTRKEIRRRPAANANAQSHTKMKATQKLQQHQGKAKQEKKNE